MKEPVPEDPVHKKLTYLFINNLKLYRMQLMGLHLNMKSIKNRLDEAKDKLESLFDDKIHALSMIQMNKRLKEEFQLSNRIIKVEEGVNSMERTLHTLVEGTVHTNKLLQQLLDTPTLTQTLDDNKNGEKVSTIHERQINQESSDVVAILSSSTLNISEPKKKRSVLDLKEMKKIKISKAKRDSVDEMIKEIQDQKRAMALRRKST